MLEYFYKNSAHISQTKQITPLKIFPLSHFNPRSREGSDQGRAGAEIHWRGFQSTLPRGERHIGIHFPAHLVRISIHAPARGATGAVKSCGCLKKISIHAPARGATIFDLVSHTGAPISIHAPARGATKIFQYYQADRKISIHAPARGATGYQCSVYFIRFSFQSTLPRGERRSMQWRKSPCRNFNPRSREGSDRYHPQKNCRFLDFNPRSREGSDTGSDW